MHDSWIPTEEVTLDAIEREIGKVIKNGLPLDRQTAGDLLPNLKSIWLRALVPEDRDSRIATLNQTFWFWLRELGESGSRYIGSLDAMFETTSEWVGGEPVHRRVLLYRREKVADQERVSVSHVRNHLEKAVAHELATHVYNELLHYSMRAEETFVLKSVPRFVALDAPPHVIRLKDLLDDNFGSEFDHLERSQVSIKRGEFYAWMALRNTIWQHFYACRAEFYAYASLSLVDPNSDEALNRRDRAIQERAALGELIEQWHKSFPDQTLAKPSNLPGSEFWIEYSATGFEAVLDKESAALFREISSWRYEQRQMHL